MGKWLGQTFKCDYADKGKFYEGECKKIVLHPHLGTPAAFCIDPKLGVFYVALGMEAMEEYVPEPPKEVVEHEIEFVVVPRSVKGGQTTVDGKAVPGEVSEDNIF